MHPLDPGANVLHTEGLHTTKQEEYVNMPLNIPNERLIEFFDKRFYMIISVLVLLFIF